VRLVALVFALALTASVLGVTPGQTDNFEDGTTQGWTDGQGNNTANIVTGGPAGAGDNYLQVSSGTFGGGPHLTVFNRSQWSGDYLAAGATNISMDLKNFGSGFLHMRLVIRDCRGKTLEPRLVIRTFRLANFSLSPPLSNSLLASSTSDLDT